MSKKIIMLDKTHRIPGGQGLIEFALILPLLLLFIIGVFEVGWLIRNYLVLVNANREITRFAVRPDYLDFSNPNKVAWNRVRDHLDTTLNKVNGKPGALDLNLNTNATLIISHLVSDPQEPCVDITTCDCSWFEKDNWETTYATQIQHLDDLNFHPGMSGYQWHTKTYGISRTTRLDYDNLLDDMKAKSNFMNCSILKRNLASSTFRPLPANSVIVTELFYEPGTLTGLIPFQPTLYSHTTMRLLPESSNKLP